MAGSRSGQRLERKPVPILTYHSLDKSGSPISIAPDVFRRQMQALRERDYRVLRVRDLLDGWDDRQPLPPRPVVLCFDDGFASVLEHAAPILTELGFAASIFMVAGYCGRDNDWPSQPRGVPRLPLLSWSALEDLSAAGFEVGAHSLTHPCLMRLTDHEAEYEIVGSKQRLEDRLGKAIEVFAYPYGRAGRKHRAIAEAHYRAACGVILRTAEMRDDRYNLPRIDMYYFRAPSFFRFFGTPLGRAYLGLRALGRNLRGIMTSRGSFSNPPGDDQHHGPRLRE